MVGGVAGALIGLLFVAISINLDRIIAGANLPRRALETVAVLVAILTVAVLGLVPQPGWAIGVETLLLAAGVLILLVGRLRHLGRSVEQRRFRNVPAVVLAAFALPLAAAGLTLSTGPAGVCTGSCRRLSSVSAVLSSTRGCCWSRLSGRAWSVDPCRQADSWRTCYSLLWHR